jgi:hypothetical protein
MVKYNYYDRPFDWRNLNVCDQLPENASEYVPDNPINFIDPSKSWLSNVIEIYRRFDALLMVEVDR